LSNTTFQNYDDIIERSCQAWNRLGLKNCQVGEKWVSDDRSYLCKGLYLLNKQGYNQTFIAKSMGRNKSTIIGFC
jgi:hypothetical protein